MATGNRGGRPAKPTALKELNGNPGRRPLNEQEPKFPVLIDAQGPPWLDAYGREHWEYFAPRLSASRLLTEADVSILAAACERWSVYRRAAALMKRSIRGKNRFGEYVVPPQAQIAKAALADYLVIMREFGIGPASRARVKADKGDADDPAEEFFGT